MKKIIFPLIATALFIVIVGVFLQKSSVKVPSPTPNTSQSKVIINETEIQVNLAVTTSQREKGLGEISNLDPNWGMLFVFENPDRSQSFWMKDMLIPIDIIWIKNGVVIKIDKNVPVPAKDTPENNLKVYSAGQIVDYVLEVNAGFSDKNSFKTGDAVTFSGI